MKEQRERRAALRASAEQKESPWKERGRRNKVIPREILSAGCLLAADSVSDLAGD